jgi:beta-1,4-mannosyltransferase
MGRIRAYKGLRDLIASFCEVSSRSDTLVIAGSPYPETAAEDLAQSVLRHRTSGSGEVRIVASHIPGSELQTYFNAADIVAVNYTDVPMNPGSVILAMSFARPVIAIGAGSVPDILGESALFRYDSASAGDLARAMRLSLTDGDLEHRGKEAYERAVRNHSQAAVAAAFVQFYENMGFAIPRY